MTQIEKAGKGKIWKKILLIFGITFVLLIGALIAIPYFYKDELFALAKKEINKNVNAKVDFDQNDISLSIFRNFPQLTFGIGDLSVTGIDKFDGVPLMSMERLDLSMDIMSVINYQTQPIKVNSVGLIKPDINILVLKDGTANYDIAKSSEEVQDTSAATSFQLNLNEYYIQDGAFTYDDRMGGTFLDIEGLNHSGSGDFTESIYDITTDTKIDALTAKSGGTSYLSKANLDADITVNADMNNMKFTLKEKNIKLNALEVDAVGWVQIQGEDINMDLDFKAPSTQFKHLLSMIPGAYTKDFDGVKADGNFTMNGNAKGTYNTKSLPAFNVNLGVKDGSFQYPDLPMGIKDIQTDIRVMSRSSNLDLMTVDIPSFHMLLGQNPFDATLKLRTPISDPDIDAKINGKIILEELAKAFPMEGVNTLTGIITADVEAKTKLSYIDNEQYDKVDMKGDILIENMDYIAEGMPEVLIQNMKMNFTPQNVKLENLTIKAGKSDIQANGTLDNILAYFSPEKTMTGNLKVRSNLFDANEWLSEEEAGATPSPTAEPVENEEVFDRFKFSLDAEMNKILYEDYELVNSIAKGSFTPEEINLERLSTKMGKSDIAIDGKLTNIFGYLYDNEIIGGDINFSSNYLDLNELGGYDETATAETSSGSTPPAAESEIISVPDFLNMKVNADIKEVLFTNMTLKNVNGLVSVKDEKVNLTDVKADLMGGQAKLVGNYDTSDKTKPSFELGYDISKFDFQETFKTLNTFQAAAPIGDYIKGNFNSAMTLKGIMGKDMIPDLNTITAQGMIETVNGMIQNFSPIKAIGDKLNVAYLQDDVKLTNTINKFNITDGRVIMEEFPFAYKDIDMKIAGSHGFDNTMDYLVKLKVPKELMGKGKVAGMAESGLDFLSNKASQFGVNLNAGNTVFVTLALTGDLKKPNVQIKNISLSDDGTSVKDAVTDSVKDIANEAVDSVKTVVNDKIDEVTGQVEDKANEVIDNVTNQIEDKVDDVVDNVKDQVGDKVEEVVGDRVDSLKNQVGDQIGDKVDDALDGKLDDVKDKVKDGIGGFTPPWKKKKKKDEDGE